jgi:uncharacterized OB-fold protein
VTLEIIRIAGARPYPPRVSAFTKTFWDALAQGRLTTTRGRSSGRLAFPPRPFCPHSHEREIEWVDLSGRGTLYSYTVVHAPPKAFAAMAPYRVCIVDLDEGLRVAAALTGEAPAAIGAPARAVTLLYDDGPLLGFTQD